MSADVEPKAKEVTLNIDGKEVKAQSGASILDVATSMGINIPTLCYHKALSQFGACRLCSVEIVDKRGRSRIVTSCNYPVEEGLVVSTKSEKTIKVRKLLLELLLARTPKVQKIQQLALEYGIEKPSYVVENENEDCILCGLCTRVCSELIGVNAINFANRGVLRKVTTPYDSFSDDCIGCGACTTICPTQSTNHKATTYAVTEEDAKKINDQFLKGGIDENIGVYKEMFSAKSIYGGQDGGVATALLVSGMQKGMYDTAVVVQRKQGYDVQAVVAENVDDILKAKGTKYLRAKMLPVLTDLIAKGKTRIALVGTPCEVRAARRIQQTLSPKSPDLQIVTVGLFCFEAFDYDKLKVAVTNILGIDLDSVEKTQIHKGKFIATVKGKDYSVAVKELSSALENGCPFCGDFTNMFADVSVGSVGSPDGYSTVIVRSDVGEKLLENLDLTRVDVNKEEITKLSLFKKNRAKKSFAPIMPPQTQVQPPQA
jgi:coenzyme F420-reducing hydrogenase beta subunit